VRILLDTHVLVWALSEPQRLAKKLRATISDPENDVFFSAGSIWEIAIKAQIARVRFALQPEEVANAAIASGFEELPIRSDAAAYVARLPMYHRDPFDRILIAQAICELARFFTNDESLTRYSELVTRI
jgi:PIN domain nuclease of toxin-antitoxin system